jgi:FtsP/CotA-like multicopper oxidase with cupredoxin domain
MMKLSRRTLMKLGFISAGAIALPVGIYQWFQRASNRGLSYFQTPLSIPPKLEPIRQDSTTDYYEMIVKRNWVEILPGRKTEIWGYNGITPGPTICQRSGRESVVRIINQLDKDTQGKPLSLVTHLHGMASFPQYDGYAMDIVPPNYYKDYRYTNDHKAATLWYHDHSMDKTSRNVQMGLAGMYILEDKEEAQLNLPKGDYDIPLILQTKRIDEDGKLFKKQKKKQKYWDIALVNGVPWPRFAVANRVYRFRLLNGSAGWSYRLALSQSMQALTDEKLIVIGGDGGLLPQAISLRTREEPLPLTSAERYDILIDFGKYPLGSQLYLHHVRRRKTANGTKVKLVPIMRFDIDRNSPHQPQLPQQLLPLQPLVPKTEMVERTFDFTREKGRWVINHLPWNDDRIDARPKPGATEIWTFNNPDKGRLHPVHVHLAEAQLLERNGKPPRPYERGWKDTFLLGEQESIKVILRFPSYQGKPIQGKYMMHCHNLDHEDNAMMMQFQVGTSGADPVATAPALPIV